MKLPLVILIFFAIACKPQEKNQAPPPVELQTIGEYTPNPDEVVLFLTLVESEKLETGWRSTAEVKRQVRAGFGFNESLPPGKKITVQSKDEIPAGDFYCAADYRMAPGGGLYVLKFLLRK
ncbi:MAG: hypothetical protein ABJP45_15645 [Cyclobacteriaceae bacterium]